MVRKAKLPSAEDIVGFLSLLEGQSVSKREIAKNFGIKGMAVRQDLKILLKEMAETQQIEQVTGKRFRLPQSKAEQVKSIELVVRELNDDGEVVCEPTDRRYAEKFPLIILDKNNTNLSFGDHFLARLEEFAEGEYIAHPLIKKDQSAAEPLMAVFSTQGPRESIGSLTPLNKELSHLHFGVFEVDKNLKAQLKDGVVVLMQAGERPRRGPAHATVLEIVKDSLKGTEYSLAIQNHGLPHVFPSDVLSYCEKIQSFTGKEKQGREDLTPLSLVTIDGEDAKDFDDAVWAEPWEGDDKNKSGGYHIIVAIADVAHYVKEGSPLDIEAFNRGNSVYLPGMVIPMLPEKLSNDLCSLRPKEDRPVMAVHLYINKNGTLVKHEFVRAVIHSKARLTYNQVEEALKKNGPTKDTDLVWGNNLQHLYNAYKIMLKAREKRGALDLDIGENMIVFADKEENEIQAIQKRDRLDAHKLIEEMMILANVAAASALQTKGAPCLFRVHPEPGTTKLETLQASLKSFNLKIDVSGGITPKKLQGLLDKIGERDDAESIHQLMLRSQEQARYDPENIGHFGLALQRYAHFTSPIRRYSDLVVHRSLIKTLKLADYKEIQSPQKLKGVGEHLGITERRAQKAEWEVKDRLITRFYSKKVGNEFIGKVVSVTKFGMFLSIEDGIAEGLLPLRLMRDDHYVFHDKNMTLTGARTKRVIKIGDKLPVTLIEADEINARLTFTPTGEDSTKPRPRRPKRSFNSERHAGKKAPRRNEKFQRDKKRR